MSKKLPPRSVLEKVRWILHPGDQVTLDQLRNFLKINGYVRTQNVYEPGEWAMRGGIIDLFPPTSDHPIRLDFYGDILESLRLFDVITQRTLSQCDSLTLMPTTEFCLDPESITRFQAGYRACFGAVTDEDPLYEAVRNVQRYRGMEHWLPLFHDHMHTLFDYHPQAIISLDQGVEQNYINRLTSIRAAYQERYQSQTVVTSPSQNPIYKPLPPNRLYLDEEEWQLNLMHSLVVVLSPFASPDDTLDVFDAAGRARIGFVQEHDHAVFEAVQTHITKLHAAHRQVIIAAYSAGSRERLQTILAEKGICRTMPITRWEDMRSLPAETIGLAVLTLENGFDTQTLTIITERDILGNRLTRHTKSRRHPANILTEATSLSKGDLVVHIDHGIGRYEGIETLKIANAAHDCLLLSYEGDDRLYIPVENIDVLSRYGAEDADVSLDKLGSVGWQNRKAKVKKRLKDMAEILVRLIAERTLSSTSPLSAPPDLYDRFCARFPYPETEDQLQAIEDIRADLTTGKPMDRLICGDSGFGKTEVALRTSLIVASAGLQVAVVVPTTLLARQHYNTFMQRFVGLPMIVAHLSRLVQSKEVQKVKEGLAQGTVDIIIGTHTLLSKTIPFKRLGLIIVDEEQHFGVKQKEYLKTLRKQVHVLTMTATPLPRTLQMALCGVRDISIISTPPIDRLAVRTFVLAYDAVAIRKAILREYDRGGQCFYVCPRITDLSTIATQLETLVPEVTVVMVHGQMSASALEKVMGHFDAGLYQVLLSTNIIESGIDQPNVNTLIVHRADMFGLAQLYQLRGRVGRSRQRAYAYFTYPAGSTMRKTAKKRLEIIQILDSLSVGFQLASHDMDLRGTGNLLGEEQSGHIREVGVELFQHMLTEALQRVSHGDQLDAPTSVPLTSKTWSPQVRLGLSVRIPHSYVPDLDLRIALYRRLVDIVDSSAIEEFRVELIDRFGSLPLDVENLLQVMIIKQLCRIVGVTQVEAAHSGIVLTFHHDTPLAPERLIAYLQRHSDTLSLRPDFKLVHTYDALPSEQRIKEVHRFLSDLVDLLATS